GVGVMVDHVSGLGGQVDAGALGKAERLEIIVEGLRPQRQAHLDKVDVAAVVQRGGHVLPAVDRAVGAVVGMLVQVAAGVDGPAVGGADKLLVGSQRAGIQRRGG